MEIEQHCLACQVGEAAHIAMVVRQSNLYDIRGVHLRGVDALLAFGELVLHDSHILHSLDGNVVEVFATKRTGIVCIPACGNGSERLDVFLALTGIEDESLSQSLEQGEIRGCLHRLLVDIVALALSPYGWCPRRRRIRWQGCSRCR